ncbi:phenylalanine--tRNA ligase subunit beta [Halorientalis sp. IM1011]|uniref:phenylalanine--tRNA ligase subunit beta n=1 Tax=Halorientalis sp. IM1011 TaxID=1932360 RepID=UPI00097CC666|nr:phenylalanine--tRNA ligase subunit beta [Halorientalis sp. IM1011]AQL43052.1 phenylalanine--tRNA ligase subunit beta [Halorientalis sp. IM1011]
MPTVTVDPDELRTLTGHDEKDDEQLKEDLFGLGLEFEGETDDGEFELEFAPDRLDRLSVEGVARSLRYHYGDDRGVYVPSTNDAEWTIRVEDVPEERPYVTGAIVRGLDMDDAALESLIQVQEKLHATMGRQRAKGAIGVHDLTMLKGETLKADDDRAKSITYTGVDPDEETMVPLEGDQELTLREVLDVHHIGQEYADLVADYESMPAIYDEVGLFSFPPVVNGRRTEVDEGSRDLFVEMTGTDQWTVDKMLNIVCYALDARGGQVEEVNVEYTDDAPATPEAGSELVRPDLVTKRKTVAHDDIETMLGVDLDERDVVDLIERAGMDAERTETDDGAAAYRVEVPPYRTDVLHPVDLIDDVGRAYGFNELEPRYPDVSTVGGRHERSRLEDAVRDRLVGQGFEDLLNFHLIDEEQNYERLNVPQGSDAFGGGEAVTIEQPYSEDFTMVRSWALPSIMMVLENNTHRAYPQDLAEVGFSAHVDERENTNVAERRTVAAALCHAGASYEDAKAALQALVDGFDADLETPATEHPTFISGRTASVVIDGEEAGIVGEVHPEVVVEHDLELPVAAFEFDLDALQ